MRHFRIFSFTGIEAHRDDADRGSLRIAEGCVPAGKGGLRSAPVFTEIGTVGNVSTDTNNHLTGVDDADGNSLLFASRQDEVHDVRIFSQPNTELGMLGTPYDVSVPTGGGTLYPDRPASMSSVGNNEVYWGDGSSEAATIGVTGRIVAPNATLYHLEWARFPKCRFFVIGPKKTIFAAGNPDEPLTVYISEPADMQATHRDALYSDKPHSTVKILMADGNSITALSGGRDHVVVHTDGGAHLLKMPQPNQAATGYRVEQSPLTAASASVNHNVVAGESGSYPFWLGFDGQIYKDESGTRGPEAKDAYADPDQVSWMAKGRWDSELPTDLSNSFASYNPQLGFYWLFARNDDYTAWDGAGKPASWSTPPKYKSYLYSERSNSLSGPMASHEITSMTSVPNTSKIIAVDQESKVWKADLDHFTDKDFPAVSDPWPDTSVNPGGRYVAADADGSFLYRGRYLSSPFAEPTQGTGALNNPMYFGNASLSIAETAWMPLGDEHSEKQVHSVHLTFSSNSTGRVWAYVESDEGLVSGQYKGTISQKMKVFTNIRGVRFRVRLFVVTSEGHPWNLREMVIGHLAGTTT
jgi:hypothetical protein